MTGCRHGREVGHRRAARRTRPCAAGRPNRSRASRRRPPRRRQPQASEIQPDVLVPDRGEPVGGERRRHRPADHEPEVARPAHRHEPAVDPGGEVIDDSPWVAPGPGGDRRGAPAARRRSSPVRRRRAVPVAPTGSRSPSPRRDAGGPPCRDHGRRRPALGRRTCSDGHRVATPLGPSCRTKVKEFTQFRMPKPLENGASTGTIPTLLSQPSCPSAKAMGR